jgi:hypothetical protein
MGEVYKGEQPFEKDLFGPKHDRIEPPPKPKEFTPQYHKPASEPRISQAELEHARQVRRHRMICCWHEPRCDGQDTCNKLFALELRERKKHWTQG